MNKNDIDITVEPDLYHRGPWSIGQALTDDSWWSNCDVIVNTRVNRHVRKKAGRMRGQSRVNQSANQRQAVSVNQSASGKQSVHVFQDL